MTSDLNVFLSVCSDRGILVTNNEPSQSAFCLHFGKSNHYIIHRTYGINDESVAVICRDKLYQYQLLAPIVKIPHTIGYFDPNPLSPFYRFVTQTSVDEIVKIVTQSFSLPVIVKKNTGSKGSEVYLCKNAIQIKTSLKHIYSRKNAEYDHIALAQQYILTKHEYRVIVFNRRVSFAYIKDTTQASFRGNLSPLHWENSSAVLVTNETLLSDFQKIVDNILSVVPMVYGGIDIIESLDGHLYLIELNSSPGYEEYLKYCDPKPLRRLYGRILEYLKEKYFC